MIDIVISGANGKMGQAVAQLINVQKMIEGNSWA